VPSVGAVSIGCQFISLSGVFGLLRSFSLVLC
jgi:hypothetical protein